eukprot:TRINITY_DN6198_c0_g1_i1.p1 TRINITY_DN6198_c0_g1~~TRINITY_DN6198_c0_g1_i1.p1  ORF type:complete len:252 (+),score=53.06 TRINITY_DN6198_c0_g1_i1:67-822(+)
MADLAFTAVSGTPLTLGATPLTSRFSTTASSSHAPNGLSFAAASATVLGGAGILSALAVGGRSRRSMKAARNVLTKDDEGRYRFEAPAKPLVIKEQPGVTMPLGFFDPLGFTSSGLMTFPGDPTGFLHLRRAEIKHGRVAMMAAVGSVFAHYVKLPGFDAVPTGLKALNTEMGSVGFTALFLFAGLIEVYNWKQSKAEPGSYGDPFKLNQYTPEMRDRELNNGRMAMFAVMGQILAELQTAEDPVQQLGWA